MSLINILNSPKFKKGVNTLIEEHSYQVMQDCYEMCVVIEGKDGKCAQAIKNMQKMKTGMKIEEPGVKVGVSYDDGGKGATFKTFKIPYDLYYALPDDGNDIEEMILRYIDENYNPFSKGLKNADAEVVGFHYS